VWFVWFVDDLMAADSGRAGAYNKGTGDAVGVRQLSE
jgi:hypothetical protein